MRVGDGAVTISRHSGPFTSSTGTHKPLFLLSNSSLHTGAVMSTFLFCKRTDVEALELCLCARVFTF